LITLFNELARGNTSRQIVCAAFARLRDLATFPHLAQFLGAEQSFDAIGQILDPLWEHLS
jgi:hypothetical protein